MVTPKDIENKEFTRGMRGYKEDEVDDFLDLIIVDMERLIKENKILKGEVLKLKKEVDEKKDSEESVVKTLEAAKALMNDISASSERRAQVMLKNAELDAEAIQREARESVTRYTQEGNRLMERVETFKRRYRDMLQDEMERINNSTGDLVSEFEKTFLPPDADVAEKKEKAKPASKPLKEEAIKAQAADLGKTAVLDRSEIQGKEEKTENLDKTIVKDK